MNDDEINNTESLDEAVNVITVSSSILMILTILLLIIITLT